jgi:hypothetical protein
MKQVISILCLLVFSFSVKAADLIVEEFGTAPTYGSIASAVAASVNGDRIIIKNRAGDIPWIENITINKSLTFLSYTNNTQFIVQGTYTIDFAAGREVNIIGMKNTSGSIVSGAGTAATRTHKIGIYDSWLLAGAIDLDYAGCDVQVVGNRIDAGYAHILYGNIIGNDITYSSINPISISPTGSFQNDTCYVVGNKVNCLSTSSSANAILIQNGAQVYHVRNNYVIHKNVGIKLVGGNTSQIPNLIWNNTVITNQIGSFSSFGIEVQGTTGAVFEIMNNILKENSTGSSTYGIYSSSGGQVNAYYNIVDSAFDVEITGNFTFLGNNTTNQAITINSDGTLPAGSPGINGGNPSQPYYDLDLSIGDAGAYGGSYTLNNFFPLFTGAARVYFVKFPFNVRQGSTLSIKAFGYDR